MKKLILTMCLTAAGVFGAAAQMRLTLGEALDLSYNRRTDQEYREVKKSYLSVLLSGTPAQVKPLIPSTENWISTTRNCLIVPGFTPFNPLPS